MYCARNGEISIHENCFFLMLIILKQLYERMICVLLPTVMVSLVGVTEILGDVVNQTRSSLDIEGVIAKAVDIFHV